MLMKCRVLSLRYDVLELYYALNLIRNRKNKFCVDSFKTFDVEHIVDGCDISSHIIKTLIDNFYNTDTWKCVLKDMKEHPRDYAKNRKVIITYPPTTPTPNILNEFKYMIDLKNYEPDLELLTVKLPSYVKNAPNMKIVRVKDNVHITLKFSRDEIIKAPINISTIAKVKTEPTPGVMITFKMDDEK